LKPVICRNSENLSILYVKSFYKKDKSKCLLLDSKIDKRIEELIPKEKSSQLFMISLFMLELSLPTANVPPAFSELDDELFNKWKLLKTIVIKDVLTHMTPFVVDTSRVSFYELINSTFLLFRNSEPPVLRKSDRKNLTISQKAMVLTILHTEVPKICNSKCCFHFKGLGKFSEVYVMFSKNKCTEIGFTSKYSYIAKDIFDKWYGKKSFGDYTIIF